MHLGVSGAFLVALQSRSSNSGPRELFSISPVEKAFGAAYMPEGSEGCIRAWGERYLTGLKEPEITYSEALALPERTPEEKKERSSYIAKTFGKALEARADEWFITGTASFSDEPGKRLFPGLHLLPHPTQLDVLPDGSRGYLNQQAVGVKLFSGASPEAISFQGFKDAIFLVGGSRFLVDYKTTKPKVDNRKNAELGKPAGWWTWMKTPEQLLGDYQWNLYQWDEYSKHERFVPSRWVYFASQETPQARAVDVQVGAIDPDRVKRVCTQLADRANVLRSYIRGWRASTDRAAFTASLPKNVTSCNAFGRLCPYHVRSPGGTCAGDTDQVIPVGQLLTAPNARPIKSVTVPVFEPGAFQFAIPHVIPAGPQWAPTGASTDMSIRDTINQALAQNGAAPGAQPPSYGPSPGAPTGFVPQGSPPVGAQPFPQAAPAPAPFQGGHPAITQPFQPAPGQPGYTPQAAQAAPQQPAPHVGPPEYQAQPQAPQAAPAPVQQQAPLAAPSQHPAFGTQANAEWCCDGQGGYFSVKDIPAMLAAGHPQALALWGQLPTAAQQSLAPQGTLTGGVQAPTQVTPGETANSTQTDDSSNVSEADLTALGALFLTLIQSAVGMLNTGTAPDAPKKKAGRPKKSA